VGVVDAAIFDLIFDAECRRRASAFKEREKPSGSPRAYLLASFTLICWIAFEAKASIIVFNCCLDS
jgi:hypothetical protein